MGVWGVFCYERIPELYYLLNKNTTFFFKEFFMWTIFKVFIEFVIILLLFYGHKACGILAPQPGIEPVPPALEGEVLTTGPPRLKHHLLWASLGRSGWTSKSPAVLEPRRLLSCRGGCFPTTLTSNFLLQKAKTTFLLLQTVVTAEAWSVSPHPPNPHMSTLYPYHDLVNLRSDQWKKEL